MSHVTEARRRRIETRSFRSYVAEGVRLMPQGMALAAPWTWEQKEQAREIDVRATVEALQRGGAFEVVDNEPT